MELKRITDPHQKLRVITHSVSLSYKPVCADNPSLFLNLTCLIHQFYRETHGVGSAVSVFPLDQDDLSDHQRGDEDQDHLSVHGLMTSVLNVQFLMLDSTEKRR